MWTREFAWTYMCVCSHDCEGLCSCVTCLLICRSQVYSGALPSILFSDTDPHHGGWPVSPIDFPTFLVVSFKKCNTLDFLRGSGNKLRSSRLCGKKFSDWALIPAPKIICIFNLHFIDMVLKMCLVENEDSTPKLIGRSYSPSNCEAWALPQLDWGTTVMNFEDIVLKKWVKYIKTTTIWFLHVEGNKSLLYM